MFDFGLSEMVLTGVVALIVLGPERLPKVARSVGRWIGKVRHFAGSMKDELNRQMDAAELSGLKETKEQIESAVQEVNKELQADLPAWERLPEQKTPADFGIDESSLPSAPSVHGGATQHDVASKWCEHDVLPHRRSVKCQSMGRKRDMRPRFRAKPSFRVRRP